MKNYISLLFTVRTLRSAIAECTPDSPQTYFLPRLEADLPLAESALAGYCAECRAAGKEFDPLRGDFFAAPARPLSRDEIHERAQTAFLAELKTALAPLAAAGLTIDDANAAREAGEWRGRAIAEFNTSREAAEGRFYAAQV